MKTSTAVLAVHLWGSKLLVAYCSLGKLFPITGDALAIITTIDSVLAIIPQINQFVTLASDS
ncbi:MAG TPA: hypothetical protein VK203_29320 [Nostocaceae cyanobacterium]|nr:hypothetical protein [Nostocaceae cyanobacterium]